MCESCASLVPRKRKNCCISQDNSGDEGWYKKIVETIALSDRASLKYFKKKNKIMVGDESGLTLPDMAS